MGAKTLAKNSKEDNTRSLASSMVIDMSMKEDSVCKLARENQLEVKEMDPCKYVDEESIDLEGSISYIDQTDSIVLEGSWSFKAEHMGLFSYVLEEKGVRLNQVPDLTEATWSGFFTMYNPAFGVKKKKKNVKRILNVPERFIIEPVFPGNRVCGIGKNRFGRFSVKGGFQTLVFRATKEYLPRRDTKPVVASPPPCEEPTRSSKRQRVPNRMFNLDMTQQNYAFISRHGDGSSLSPSELANASGGYHEEFLSGDASPPVSYCSNAYMNYSPEERDKLIKHPHLQDVVSLFRKPLDHDKAASIRKIAKRRTHALVRQLIRDQTDLKNGISPVTTPQNKKANVLPNERLDKSVSTQVYQGGMVDNKRHGYGVCAFENGIIYQGTWSAGKMHGPGILLTKRGHVFFQGDFQENVISGKGTYCFDNGDRYDGEFRDGVFQGHGVYYFAGKQSTYTGDWKHGLRHGVGMLSTLSNGSFYNGEWQLDKWSGRGRLYLEDLCDFEGNFKENLFDGRGVCQYPNSSSFEGTFKAGMKDGRGTYTFENGSVYEGRFKNDRTEGFGTVILKNDESIKLAVGQWMVPVPVLSEMRFVHRAAGFTEDGK